MDPSQRVLCSQEVSPCLILKSVWVSVSAATLILKIIFMYITQGKMCVSINLDQEPWTRNTGALGTQVRSPPDYETNTNTFNSFQFRKKSTRQRQKTPWCYIFTLKKTTFHRLNDFGLIVRLVAAVLCSRTRTSKHFMWIFWGRCQGATVQQDARGLDVSLWWRAASGLTSHSLRVPCSTPMFWYTLWAGTQLGQTGLQMQVLLRLHVCTIMHEQKRLFPLPVGVSWFPLEHENQSERLCRRPSHHSRLCT